MAEKRKLQIEIDKTMKRVDEGLEEFDNIFTKINATGHQSQKEKLENELKREIKKLQRFRDQIKVWQASSDVKDKMPLDEARRKIEKEMERFKVCEREFKMKAFSKEGLAAKAKVDPHEEERCRNRDWINEIINKLSTSVDQYEAEIEILLNKKGKSKNDNDKVNELQTLVYQHNWHQQKLEQILRRLENDSINMSLLDNIKEITEYYVKYHEESDFYFDENVYVDLKLEEPEEPSDSVDRKESDDLHSDLLDEEYGNIEEIGQNDTKEKVSDSKKEESKNKNESISSCCSNADTTHFCSLSSKSSSIMSSSPPLSSVPSSFSSFDFSSFSKSNTTPLLPHPETLPSYSSWSRRYNTNSSNQKNLLPSTSSMICGSSLSSTLEVDSRSTDTETTHASSSFSSSFKVSNSFLLNKNDSKSNKTVNSTQDLCFLSRDDNKGGLVEEKDNHAKNEAEKTEEENKEKSKKTEEQQEEPKVSTKKKESSFDFSNRKASDTFYNYDFDSIESLLESSHRNCPTKSDSEKSKNVTQRILINQPHQSFPTTSLQNHATEQFFKKVDLDTLFFVFYYQQGSYNQYLAARELKRQSWRFHKKYLTWFQRREEPRVTNEKFEQGTYLYFDFENTWTTRIKAEFTFEYQWLEDEVPV